MRIKSPVEREPEWHCYMAMLMRCHSKNAPNYARYGGRGIVVCEKWRKGFWYFIEDIGRRPSSRHTLDRFPNRDGNYEPGNVRWALPKEQSRNMRSNRVIEFNGKRKTMKEWAEVLGINYRTLQGRLDRGWPLTRAMS